MMIKTYFENDLRLFEMNEDASFDELHSQVRDIYGLDGDVTLKFVDADGDLITLSTDSELMIARKMSSGTMKVMVFAEEKADGFFLSSSSSSSSEEESSEEEDEDDEDEESKAHEVQEQVGELFKFASARLALHGVDVSAADLALFCSALRLPPRRLVKKELVTKEEVQAKPVFPEEGQDAITVLSNKPTKRADRAGNNNKALDPSMLLAALQRAGPCQLTPESLLKLMHILQVRPRRFVKMGLMAPQELKHLKRERKMRRRGGRGGGRWNRQGGRGGRRGGMHGHPHDHEMHQHPHGHPHAHPHGHPHDHPHGHEMHHPHQHPHDHPHQHPHDHPHGHPHQHPHDHPHGHKMHHPHGHPHGHPGRGMHHRRGGRGMRHHGMHHRHPHEHPPLHHHEHPHHHRRLCPFGGRKGKALARFVRHQTFPDQSTVLAGQPFEKVWIVRNDGEQDWPEKVLLLPSGRGCADFGIEEPVSVEGGCTQGEERPLQCLLQAPELPGLYEAMFRLKDVASDHKFGQSLWVKVLVIEEAQAVANEEDFIQVDKI